METLLLVDGNAIMHRAYYALPPFKTKDGTPTNAIYGFFTMLSRSISDFNPQYIAICFDTPKPTFRQKIFKSYQSQRPELKDEFRVQIPIIKKLLNVGGIFHEEKEGIEADDIIGTVTERLKKEKDIRVLILTGDRDMMQLVNKRVFVVSPQIGVTRIKIYDENEVLAKLGIKPEQLADYKALVGDASDNYPGAKGIGPKTAIGLIRDFGTVENLLQKTNKITDERIKKIIEQEKENILLSKKLAKIVTDAQIKFNLDDAKFTGFKKELRDEFLKLEISSLATRFFQEKPEKKSTRSLSSSKRKKLDDSQIGLF